MRDRIRKNCSDNIINDITFKRRLIEYKPCFMKCGHSEKDTNSAFCKTATRTKKETLKKKPKRKQNNKIKFITEYGPSLPNIYSIWRITNKLKNNEELKNMFKNSVK